MPLTIDEKIAQLQAIRDQYGGDLLLLRMRDVPSLEFRKSADGGTEVYGIRHLPDGLSTAHLKNDEESRKGFYRQAITTGLVAS